MFPERFPSAALGVLKASLVKLLSGAFCISPSVMETAQTTVITVDEHGPLCLFCYRADTQMTWVSLLLPHLGPQMEIPAKLERSLPVLHLNNITCILLWKTKSPSEQSVVASEYQCWGRFYPLSHSSSGHVRYWLCLQGRLGRASSKAKLGANVSVTLGDLRCLTGHRR